MITRGNRKAVRLVGFIEVLLWVIAIGQIIQNLNNWAGYLAWALGFTVGSMIGFKIEDRLALGKHQLRIITSQPIDAFLEALKGLNQGFTVFDGMGSQGPVKQIFLILNRQNNKEITALVKQHIPTSFCSVSDVMATDSGLVLPNRERAALLQTVRTHIPFGASDAFPWYDPLPRSPCTT